MQNSKKMMNEGSVTIRHFGSFDGTVKCVHSEKVREFYKDIQVLNGKQAPLLHELSRQSKKLISQLGEVKTTIDRMKDGLMGLFRSHEEFSKKGYQFMNTRANKHLCVSLVKYLEDY